MKALASPSLRGAGRRASAPRLLALAALGLAAAGCTQPTSGSRDTGTMAYPSPQPQGSLGTTGSSGSLRPTDTGTMAYPSPQPQGNLGTTTTGRGSPDTGTMAYPSPQPQGNVGRTRTQ